MPNICRMLPLKIGKLVVGAWIDWCRLDWKCEGAVVGLMLLFQRGYQRRWQSSNLVFPSARGISLCHAFAIVNRRLSRLTSEIYRLAMRGMLFYARQMRRSRRRWHSGGTGCSRLLLSQYTTVEYFKRWLDRPDSRFQRPLQLYNS